MGMSTGLLFLEVSSVTPFVESICGESHDFHTVGGSSVHIPVNELLQTGSIIYCSLNLVFWYIAFITNDVFN